MGFREIYKTIKETGIEGSPVKLKIFFTLLETSMENNGFIPLNQSEISRSLKVSRWTVNKVFTLLRNKEVLEKTGRNEYYLDLIIKETTESEELINKKVQEINKENLKKPTETKELEKETIEKIPKEIKDDTKENLEEDTKIEEDVLKSRYKSLVK